MQNKFDCIDQVRVILYGEVKDKFIIDEKTGKSSLNPEVIRNLKEFNLLKKMVSLTADPISQQLDISLLKSYIEQIDLRYNIM
jgi:hypothetical protein